MALKGLATQAELATLQDALDSLAENLRFHVNETPSTGAPLGSSLSLAHGIDLVVGYNDGYNDLTTYQDSAGDLVSDAYTAGKANFVRFIVAGQPYYAPVQTTTEPAGAAISGILGSVNPPSTAPGGSSLITAYITTEAQTAVNVNSLLLEHTRLPAEDAHVVMTITPGNTLDTSGHIVATHNLHLQLDGVVYHIPVCSRFGGPIQPPRGGYYAYSYLASEGYHGTGAPTPPTTCPTALGGTGPFVIALQYWDGASWQNALPTYPANTLISIPAGDRNGHGPIPIMWSDSTGCITVYSMGQGNNDTSVARLRMKFTGDNGAGTTITSNEITISMTEKDPGCIFLFRTALDWKLPDFVLEEAKSEFYGATVRRGYKRFCFTAVPLMQKSKFWFKLIKRGIVTPFLWWGAYRYRRSNRFGWLFGAYCRAWLLFWETLGIFVKDCANPPGWTDKELTVIDTKPKP